MAASTLRILAPPVDCDVCPRLCESRRTVVQSAGPLDASICLVTMQPDKQGEARRNPEPLIGPQGFVKQRLTWLLKEYLDVDYEATRRELLVHCRPPRGSTGDKPSTPVERDNCSGYFLDYLQSQKPDVVLALGDAAIRWFDPEARVGTHHGRPFDFKIPDTDTTILVVPMYNPSASHPRANPGLVDVILADWARLGEILKGRRDESLGDYTGASDVDIVRLLSGVKRFAFDFETTDPRWRRTFQPTRCSPIGYSVCVKVGEAIYRTTTDIETLRPFLEDPSVEVIAHNAVFEYLVALGQGITIRNLHDAKLLAYVLRLPSTQLKDLSWAELGVRQTRFEAVNWEDSYEVIQYGSADSDLELRLFERLEERVRLLGLGELYEMERRLIPILGDMQARGIRFDPAPCLELGGRLIRGRTILNGKLISYFGGTALPTEDQEAINLNSDHQLRKLLYGAPGKVRVLVDRELKGRLAHDPDCKRKECVSYQCVVGVRTGARTVIKYFPAGLGWEPVKYTPSGDASVDMDTLRHPNYRGEECVFNLVLLKSIVHLLNNNIKRLPELVHEDGRIHPAFHQAGQWEEKPGLAQEGADTQRLTSSGPNLQNITHHGDSERPYMAKWAADLRRSFIPEDGCVLMTSDAGQEEPRIGAFVSGEDLLLEELSGVGDVYCPVATFVYGREITKAQKEERQIGKRNFMGWLNGAGHEGIRTAAYWLTPEEGQAVVDFLSDKYRNVEAKRRELVEHLYDTGYTETLFGFRVYRPAIFSGPGAARNHAERSVMPDLIQGSAAGVMKIWLWKMSEALKDRGLNHDCHILLTIHDEMVFEIKPHIVKEVEALCQEMMDGIIGVYIPAEVNIGTNWTDMTPTDKAEPWMVAA